MNKNCGIIPKCASQGVTITINIAIYIVLAIAITLSISRLFQMAISNESDKIEFESATVKNFFDSKVKNVFNTKEFNATINKVIMTCNNTNDNIRGVGDLLDKKEDSIEYNAIINIKPIDLKDTTDKIAPIKLKFIARPEKLIDIYNDTKKLKFEKKLYVLQNKNITTNWKELDKILNNKSDKKFYINKDNKKSKYSKSFYVAKTINMADSITIRNNELRECFYHSGELTLVQKVRHFCPFVSEDASIFLKSSPLYTVITITIGALTILFSTYVRNKMQFMYECKKHCLTRNITLILISIIAVITIALSINHYISTSYSIFLNGNFDIYNNDHFERTVKFLLPLICLITALIIKKGFSWLLQKANISIYQHKCNINE